MLPLSFYIAPCGLDGELLGVAGVRGDDLDEILITQFQARFSDLPSTSRTKCLLQDEIWLTLTGSSSNAMGNIAYGDKLVSLFCLLNDDNSASGEVAGMFAASIARSVTSAGIALPEAAFESLTQIRQRPLMIVLTWPYDEITDDQYDRFRFWTTHVAAGYFLAKRRG